MKHPLDSEEPATRLFGVPTLLDLRTASMLTQTLRRLLTAQLLLAGSSNLAEQVDVSDFDLRLVLDALRTWFDPVAKGERIRKAVEGAPRHNLDVPFRTAETVLVIPDAEGQRSVLGQRMLVTPEGCVLLKCLTIAKARQQTLAHADGYIRLDETVTNAALLALADVYREWTRQRLTQTIALLTGEPTTLRPAAAGLLLVLLLNRNTSRERALPRPSDRRQLEIISQAIAEPALAYATTLSGSSKTTAASVDLYRGWALGELARRLGGLLHRGIGEGIYIDASGEDSALQRLADDISRRTPAARARARDAVAAAEAAYTRVRPTLAGMSLAYDRPSNTRRIRDVLFAAADAPEAE